MCTGQIRSSRRLKASTNTPEAGKLSNGRLLHDFKDVPQPYIADDIRADEDGNIWAAGGWSPNHAMNGVRVFAPDVPMAWPDQWSALGLRAPGER
jgi:sugar lactone lactonase YvrE